MFKNFIVSVMRNYRRHYGYVLINIFGLAISIAVFALIMSYVLYEYGADKFHQNYEDIYRVDLNDKYGVSPITLKQDINDRFPEVVSTRYFPRWATVIYEKKKLESKILFADAEFFEIFDYQPVDVIKGELRSGKKGVIFRKILIIIQFTISIAMISCTFAVFEQLDYFLEQDLGFDDDQVVTFRQTTEIMDNRDAFKQELLKSAHIEKVSYLYLALGRIIISSWFVEEGDSEENQRNFKMIKTEPEFLEVYGIELKSGRNFNAEIESDHEKMLVNETFVKEFITGDPLQFTIWDDTQVIGVVDDFVFVLCSMRLSQ
ncbi:MAG: ABC transporter permease [Candidatus Stygibacter frigidus]|nr:ABC transporter permease [Candidatus Stygibacter frigidus]